MLYENSLSKSQLFSFFSEGLFGILDLEGVRYSFIKLGSATIKKLKAQN
jgi:hypothetical protein